jgi:hypothetical protein
MTAPAKITVSARGTVPNAAGGAETTITLHRPATQAMITVSEGRTASSAVHTDDHHTAPASQGSITVSAHRSGKRDCQCRSTVHLNGQVAPASPDMITIQAH